uniref:Flagellar biosynthesis protein FlhF n=1 Tax=Gracilinema caldarium TaxID=215591 RepID=A0A7C3IIA2_9SPIR
MEYFTEQAPTHAECIRKIKEKYGDNAKILMRKSVRIGGFLGLFARDGVEMTGIVSNETPLRYTADPLKNVRKPLDLEEEKRKILAVANTKTDPTIQTVLQEVRSLKEKLETAQVQSKTTDEHPNLIKIGELLYLNDFSHNYTQSIQNRIKRDFSLEALEDFENLQNQVIDWIGESINLYQEPSLLTKPRVLILVGPTGVGKTTTIAKLAALYGLGINGNNPLSVRMITIDNYRIAAKQQIETYGDIMQIPVSCVETYEDLRKTIAMYSQEVDLVLVDTIGKSPRDAVKLAEMKEILSACGSGAEVHLALSASTKSSDIKEIMQQYEPFNYRSIIVTKLDETSRVGNIVSALAERGKTVSFITNGQRVPQDIERATAVRFLINLEGFRINRQRIEEKFAFANRQVL